jgi:hypothetical protein
MTVKGTDADAGRLCNGFEACLRSAGPEHGSCSLKHTLAVPERVGAGLS